MYKTKKMKINSILITLICSFLLISCGDASRTSDIVPKEEFSARCEWCGNGIRGGGVNANVYKNHGNSTVKCCSHQCKAKIQRKYPFQSKNVLMVHAPRVMVLELLKK